MRILAIIFASLPTPMLACLQVADCDRRPCQSQANPSRRGWCTWQQERSSLICDSPSQMTEHGHPLRGLSCELVEKVEALKRTGCLS